jgi:hypothetical protein
MNIFWLDPSVQKSAAYACDQHIIKMCSEHTQQLLTVLSGLGFSDLSMKPTHPGHPCIKWVASDFANFLYLKCLNDAYFEQYRLRFQKDEHLGYLKGHHDIQRIGYVKIRKAYRNLNRDRYAKLSILSMVDKPQEWITLPPLAIPEWLKPAQVSSLQQVVKAYRDCYVQVKYVFATYRHSKPPSFMLAPLEFRNSLYHAIPGLPRP